jgi:four helix bundle protein
MAKRIESHTDLTIYSKAFGVAMDVFKASKSFPKEELYSLTDQVRKSSRSVCANLAEAWRKRCYVAAFCSKLNDAEAETGETQVWIQFAVHCGYMKKPQAARLYEICNEVIRICVAMRHEPEKWCIPPRPKTANSRRNGQHNGATASVPLSPSPISPTLHRRKSL